MIAATSRPHSPRNVPTTTPRPAATAHGDREQQPPAAQAPVRGRERDNVTGRPGRGQVARSHRPAGADQQELAHPSGTITRTSTEPNSALGQPAAMFTAASRSGASITK